MNDRQLIQACINEYGGQYGKVIPVFDIKKKFRKGHVEGRFGFLANDTDTIYIVFRGSDGLWDWVDNFKFWKKNFWSDGNYKKKVPYAAINKKIKVHTGFIDQYKKVRNLIHKEIFNYDRIVVAGHSLGGALATLCALDIEFYNPNKEIKCITFGSPRVGNRYFAKSFNKRVKNSRRYVHADDIVCKVPVAWLFSYKHVDKKIRLDKSKWYYRLSGNWKDHYPQLYLKSFHI